MIRVTWLAPVLLAAVPAWGQTPARVGPLMVGNALSEIAAGGSAAQAAARLNLNLGSAAVTAIGTSGATVPLLNGANTWSGQQTFMGAGIPANDIWANTIGNCTWSTAGGADAGPCINLAYSIAAVVPGTTVRVPGGNYSVATTIAQPYAYTHTAGAGVGDPRDGFVGTVFRAATRLIWTGAADGILFDEEPTGSETLYSGDVTGITFDCASLASICAKIASVSYSKIEIGVSEPRKTGAWLTTVPSLLDSPGTQMNDISIASRSRNTSYAPTGILIDGGQGSNFNVSLNRFWSLYAWYNSGDGIVLGSEDNNTFYHTRTYPETAAALGTPFVIASPGYLMPNGNKVSTGATFVAEGERFIHVETPITVQGFTPGSTLTAGAGNTGTAAVAPVTLTTNATALIFARPIGFASTAGVVPGMDVSCAGGQGSGIPNHSTIARVFSTTLEMTSYTTGAVASGLVCTATWGVTGSAIAGTYTITATGATTYNITAPANGHSQAGIVVSGGALSFTDVVIPISGSAVAGDTFTLVVTAARGRVQIEGVDAGNGIPDPYFMPGAYGSSSTTQNPYPAFAARGASAATATGQGLGMLIPFARATCQDIPAISTGWQSVVVGSCASTATGTYSFIGNGQAMFVSGFGSATVGGLSSTFIGSFSFGGAAFGAADNGRYGGEYHANGTIAATGDAQSSMVVLRGTSSTGSAVRLTSDGNVASGINCVNIPNNAAFLVTIDIAALDHTTVSKNAVWPSWTGLLTRGAGVGTTALTLNTTPTPLTNGTLTGQAISVTADTTNGCLNISYTPPTSNTDKFNAVAKVQAVEVQ